MTSENQNDRLAALAAKRSKAIEGPAESSTKPERSSITGRWNTPSPARLVTTGVSVVSFASMVVAMGPLGADASEGDQAAPPADEAVLNTLTLPAQPQVIIEVVPNYVAPDGTPLTPEQLALLTDNPSPGLSESSPATNPALAAPNPAPVATAPPAAPAGATPTTAPAASMAPAAAAPPATAPPATAAPAAAAPPATAPPATAPPVTAAPATAPPTTAPPRSEASG